MRVAVAIGLIGAALLWGQGQWFQIGPDWGTVDLRPGESRQFTVGEFRSDGRYGRWTTPVLWELVEPKAGVSIDSHGVVSVAADAQPGPFRIRATDGSTIATREAYVYLAEKMPQVGEWRETAQLGCISQAEEMTPATPLARFALHADGTFRIAWRETDARGDYWGTYRYDAGQIALELAKPVQYTPPGLRLRGTAKLVSDEMRLTGVWLGAPRSAVDVARPACGHVFRRRAAGGTVTPPPE